MIVLKLDYGLFYFVFYTVCYVFIYVLSPAAATVFVLESLEYETHIHNLYES